IELSKVRKRLDERGLTLQLTDAAKAFVVEKGSDSTYGARPLRRAIEHLIEDPMSEQILMGGFVGKDLIKVELSGTGEDRKLEFEATNAPEKAPELALVSKPAAAEDKPE
ncbi:MAG: NDP-hexose 4-ketoreductase, partial [Planctomycetota bacterium]|nr:NDP-hexose 4-ketoreductase [Planctomycetota bacterium]